MSYINVLIHAVWGTKSRFPYLTPIIKNKVINHIKENATSKNIFIDSINGEKDHLHCLISMNTELSISKMLQLIKGESSIWINNESLTKLKFGWADEYFVESISPSDIEKIRRYIQNQEEHHKKMTFQEEYDKFLKLAKRT